MTERQEQIAVVKKLRESAEFHRVTKEIAEALLLLGRPATPGELAEIVNTHKRGLCSMLRFMVHIGTLECASTPNESMYSFARRASAMYSAHP